MPNWKTYESSVRLLSAIIAADPSRKLNYEEISKRFGGDCTKSAIENRFRRIKSDAVLLNAAMAQGVDPITVAVDSKGTNAIAEKYGEENGGMKTATPRKRATPAKKRSKDSDQDDEDGGSFEDTPTKAGKTSLNKTKGGRITKSTPSRAARPVPGTMNEDDDDNDEGFVKGEVEEVSGMSNSSDYGNNGYTRNAPLSDQYNPPASTGYTSGFETKYSTQETYDSEGDMYAHEYEG